MVDGNLTCDDCVYRWNDICEYWEDTLCGDVVKDSGKLVCIEFKQRTDIGYVVSKLQSMVVDLEGRLKVVEGKVDDGCKCIKEGCRGDC